MQGVRKTVQLDEFGQKIFEQRYAYPGEKYWWERAKVIARTVASCEKDDQKESIEKKFNEILTLGDFVPGGRIIFGAGRNVGRQNLLNCFGLEPNDSVESIGKLIKDIYNISCGGGGVGGNYSNIRPRGDDIQNIKNSAPGAISVMKMVNEIGKHVLAGKNRRTALLACLNVTHPDLIEFLDAKLDREELTQFNISVAITNRFLEAVEKDEDWYFTFNGRKYYRYMIQNKTELYEVIAPDIEDAKKRAIVQYGLEGKLEAKESVVKAKEIWDWILNNAVDSGEPGFFNIDLANSYTNVSYFEYLSQTNPCGEITIPDGGNCCLGNINLSNMVLEDGSDVDWKRLAKAIRRAVRFLDNIISINSYPTDQCKKVAERSRRIGVGVMGLHYLLIKLGYRYGSEKCLEFLERLFSTIRNEAYLASIYLSREKGSFPEFEYTRYLSEDFAKELPSRIRMLLKKYGVRNAVMLTIPPTGTTSIVFGVSSGIEPIFAAMYKRRYREGDVVKEQVVVDPLFKQMVTEGKDWSKFVGAYDVTPEEHLKVQSTIQKYIDSSISKTINLPEDYDASNFGKMLLDYLPYLKGLTLYRAGSRGEEPLEALPLTEENVSKYITCESVVADGQACTLTGGNCGE